MSDHYYGELLTKHFKHSCAVARRRGLDPSGILDSTDLRPNLEGTNAETAESADRVAGAVERWLFSAHAEKGGPGYWPDLIHYEGALFRTEAIERLERIEEPAPAAGGRPMRRSSSARIVALGHDIPALIVRLDRLDENDPLPWAVPARPTRLLIAMSPKGGIRVVRASDALEGFLKTIDGVRDFDLVVAASGIDREAARAALRSLIEIGAVKA